jgi:hypothetical protein
LSLACHSFFLIDGGGGLPTDCAVVFGLGGCAAAGPAAENKDNWTKAASMRYKRIWPYRTSIELCDLMCGGVQIC